MARTERPRPRGTARPEGEQPGPPRAPKPSQASLLAASPWLPVEYELADVTAMQALANGRADAVQQKRALDWLIYRAAGTYDLSYRPGPAGERDTAFAEGRRFVGLQAVKLLKLNPGMIRAREPRADAVEPKS